ncbi:hypothetical protein FF38_09007, partial [Lucilia cuprina]
MDVSGSTTTPSFSMHVVRFWRAALPSGESSVARAAWRRRRAPRCRCGTLRACPVTAPHRIDSRAPCSSARRDDPRRGRGDVRAHPRVPVLGHARVRDGPDRAATLVGHFGGDGSHGVQRHLHGAGLIVQTRRDVRIVGDRDLSPVVLRLRAGGGAAAQCGHPHDREQDHGCRAGCHRSPTNLFAVWCRAASVDAAGEVVEVVVDEVGLVRAPRRRGGAAVVLVLIQLRGRSADLDGARAVVPAPECHLQAVAEVARSPSVHDVVVDDDGGLRGRSECDDAGDGGRDGESETCFLHGRSPLFV